MDVNKKKEKIICEFKNFLKWETLSYTNWEKVDFFIAKTLSDAWIMARPQDENKFKNPDFKRMVNSANGKWLEKTDEGDSYKIILSTQHGSTTKKLTKLFVHEMRHCLDYQNAVAELSFEEYKPGNEYYQNWSEFRAVYAHIRYEYYSRHIKNTKKIDVFHSLSEILGKSVADCVAGLMRSQNNSHDLMHYISRYIGASRAIRNLNIQENLNEPSFQLWNLMPQYIYENMGNVFYIGNEWDNMEICRLNEIPKTYYYNELTGKEIIL